MSRLNVPKWVYGIGLVCLVVLYLIVTKAKPDVNTENQDSQRVALTEAPAETGQPQVAGSRENSLSVNTQKDKNTQLFNYQIDVCVGANDQFDCLEQYYKQLTREYGTASAFKDLKQRYKEVNIVKAQCHAFTHAIGQTAVEKYPSVSDAYTQGDPFCWSGYYHGVMEGIIAKVGRDKIAEELPSICAPLLPKGRTSFDYHNCVHGLGHGLMVLTQNELFEALKLCENLDESTDIYSCGTGAFMENIIADGRNHKTKYLKADQLLYPCTDVATKHKEACYVGQTSYIYTLTRGDFAKMFAECEKADKGFEQFCFQSVGRDASGQSSSDLINTLASCNNGRTLEQKQWCSVGAVKDFISYYHSDVQAKKLCAGFQEAVQPPCFKTLEEYYKSL